MMTESISDHRRTPVAQQWDRISRSRLDWAHQAHKRFLDSLSDHTRACFSVHDRETSVVLFGKTQVGKTTLLLKLMGVSEAYMGHVSELLRGGRKKGKSATATAMQYQRSIDNTWRITVDGVMQSINGTQLLTKLAEIRDDVESSRHVAHDPVMLSIPSNFFDNNTGDAPQVRILDLPGDNPSNPTEAKHVTAIAERYIPHADLILIVGKADDLDFINPRAFQLPGIRDWRFTPNRFRIITTYSFSPQSLRSWMDGEASVSATSFRGRLLDQISTHKIQLSDEACNPNLYFPLEFGSSWDGIKRSNPLLHEKMNPVIDQLLDELQEEIAAAAQPYGRIRQAVNAHIVAGNIKELELQKMATREATLQNALSQAGENTAQVQKLQRKEQEKIQTLPSCTFTEKDAAELRKNAGNDIFFDVNFVEDMPTNTSHFLIMICKCCSTLENAATAFEPTLPDTVQDLPHLPDIEAGIVRDLVNRCFEPMRVHLSNYWVSWYASKKGSFSKDIEMMRLMIAQAKSVVVDYVVDHSIKAINNHAMSIKQKHILLSRKVVGYEVALQYVQKKKRQLQAELSKHQQERSRFVKDMDADIAQGKTFLLILEEAFQDTLRDHKKQMISAVTPTEKFIQLLGAIALCDEKDKLLTSN
jgi:GTPase SAR1 family protein